MFKDFNVIGLLFLIVLMFSTVKACPHSRLKVYIFKSISEYKSNSLSFHPFQKQVTYLGNCIGFQSNVTIKVLGSNTLETFESNFIRKIILDGHQIEEIAEDALFVLKCLSYFSIRNKKIHTIPENLFKRQSLLINVDFSGNRITEIPDRLFRYTWVTQLNFSRNAIEVFNGEIIHRQIWLTDLDLSYNRLKRIEPLAFQKPNKLINLQLGSNQIEVFEMSSWKGLNNLNILNISNNSLPCLDLSYPFNFSQSLKEFYINHNNLIMLNISNFKKVFPNLTIFDLGKNEWYCKELVHTMQILYNFSMKYKEDDVGEPNIGGISCNWRSNAYEKHKMRCGSNHFNFILDSKESVISVYAEHLEILDYAARYHEYNIFLISVVIVVVCCDIMMKCICVALKPRNNRRNREANGNEDGDNALEHHVINQGEHA